MSDFPANLTDLKVPIFSKTAPDVFFWHLFPLRPMQQKVTLVYQAVYSAWRTTQTQIAYDGITEFLIFCDVFFNYF